MAKKKSKSDDKPKKTTLYTITLTDEQMEKLEAILHKRLWADYEVAHARFAFSSDKVNVVGYKSGKLVVQGKNTEEFVTFILEGEVTFEPKLGYDELHNPEWFEPHAGLDECGKGDLFGPLVSGCVIADGDMVRDWREAGVKDSKRVTDSSILKMDKMIRKTKGVVVVTTFAGMSKYNEMMAKPRANLNLLLAWLHAKSLEGALKKKRVAWGLLDQFSKQPLVQRYFKDETFDLQMRTKAESDPVVAAASIVARAEFVRQLGKLSEKADMDLVKGSGAIAKKQGIELFEKVGAERLPEFVKMHFRTAYEIQGLKPPEKTQWKK